MLQERHSHQYNDAVKEVIQNVGTAQLTKIYANFKSKRFG